MEPVSVGEVRRRPGVVTRGSGLVASAVPQPVVVNGPDVAEPPPVTQTETKVVLDQPWQVVVFDDPVNTIPWVVMVFRRVFGYGREKAYFHTMEVHTTGKSVLWSGARERAEHFHAQLQQAHLRAVLQRAGE